MEIETTKLAEEVQNVVRSFFYGLIFGQMQDAESYKYIFFLDEFAVSNEMHITANNFD